MRVGVIGGGFMGEALVSALLKEEVAQAAEVAVSDVAGVRREHLASDYGVVATADNIEAARAAEVLVLAVRPQEFAAVASDLRERLKGEQTVVTIMAGVPIGRVVEELGHEAVVRVMPNSAALVGQGMSVWTATEAVSADGREAVARLLRTLGRELRDSVGLRELSMGMTDDFEAAIEEGATMVRVGRAIFGPRPEA